MAGGDVLQLVQAAQEGRFARPRGADDRHDLALLDGQVDIAQDPVVTEGFRQVGDDDDVRALRHRDAAGSCSTGRLLGVGLLGVGLLGCGHLLNLLSTALDARVSSPMTMK
ncbi:hypothetical protein SDC9_107086 [bioreactor metagenome]|uniref:Uncharacterized protein n=1 Tax=bioreactor metagenome TaxID=1076179 RepID=A0A645B485_9ZZZZ